MIRSRTYLLDHVSAVHASDAEAQTPAANLVKFDICWALVTLGHLFAHAVLHMYHGFNADTNRARVERGKPPVRKCAYREHPSVSSPRLSCDYCPMRGPENMFTHRSIELTVYTAPAGRRRDSLRDKRTPSFEVKCWILPSAMVSG
jgi:hypothetical protein